MSKITDRIDAVTGITPEYLSVTPPAPKSVKIELTGRCNFRCYFCAHEQRLRSVGEMDRDFYTRVVREMRDAGVQELGVFYLGESFLCSWLPEAIEYAKKTCGYEYVFLTTNGSMATPDKVDDCMRAGLDSLKFSLNYADKAQFEEIARVKPSLFDDIERNVASARIVRDSGGYQCGLYGSYIEYDGEQGVRIKDYIDRMRAHLDDVYALPLYNQAAFVNNPDWAFVQGNRGRLDALRDPLPCWSIFTEGHISFDGRLSACCFDHDSRFTMGDLTKESFMTAWHSKPFQELRAAHVAKSVGGTICEKCVAYG